MSVTKTASMSESGSYKDLSDLNVIELNEFSTVAEQIKQEYAGRLKNNRVVVAVLLLEKLTKKYISKQNPPNT